MKESWISKGLSKIGLKRGGPTVTREPVQIRDMNENSEENGGEESGGELKKTSSVLSIFDANKAMCGLAKARLELLSPQVVLPDDVVAPTFSPFSKLPGYDLPKMPGTGECEVVSDTDRLVGLSLEIPIPDWYFMGKSSLQPVSIIKLKNNKGT